MNSSQEQIADIISKNLKDTYNCIITTRGTSIRITCIYHDNKSKVSM